MHIPVTFASDVTLLRPPLSLVKILVSHLRRHRDPLAPGLRQVLRHPEPAHDDVPLHRHPVVYGLAA